MMIALCVAERSASRRAVAAVASYNDVAPKGLKSSRQFRRRPIAVVKD
jgi:hypothetical protein